MFKEFIKRFEGRYIPLHKNHTQAYWKASLTGKSEDWAEVAKSQLEITKLFKNQKDFEELVSIKSKKDDLDYIENRQIDLLYNAYLPNQYDEKKLEEIIILQAKIENEFTNFRSEVNGKIFTDNEVDRLLKTSNDTKELKKVWLASKAIGSKVAEDVLKLVKLRNEQAVSAGFNNFHEMSLALSEQNPKDIDRIFKEVDELTRIKFVDVKKEIDEKLCERLKIDIEELKPWHYQDRFFQQAPEIYQINYDEFYHEKDLVSITCDYFSSIDLPIDDLIERSDLFEKNGKNQHAYCLDMDKDGDIRVLGNVKQNSDWMETLLHEYGHAAYDKFIDRTFPFVLRDPSNIFTTEAIAMLFGKFALHPGWLTKVLRIDEKKISEIEDDAYKIIKINQLVFCRWAMVMYYFEKGLYENPNQDLNELWWKLITNFQLISKPENRNQPDWAAKIHVATIPCYYHNYLLGELLASQLYHYLVVKIIGKEYSNRYSLYNEPKVGAFLKEEFFKIGAYFHWNELLFNSLKEPLNAKYYAEQYVMN